MLLMRLVVAGALLCCVACLPAARANSTWGKYHIEESYAELMKECAKSRYYNQFGLSFYATLGDQKKSMIKGGLSESYVTNFLNGLAWAMKRECPDVF